MSRFWLQIYLPQMAFNARFMLSVSLFAEKIWILVRCYDSFSLRARQVLAWSYYAFEIKINRDEPVTLYSYPVLSPLYLYLYYTYTFYTYRYKILPTYNRIIAMMFINRYFKKVSRSLFCLVCLSF